MHALRLPLLALLALLALPGAAAAGKPTFETIPIDESGPDEFLTEACGFPVEFGVAGTVKVSVREGRGGTVYEITRVRLTRSFTNAETGETVTTRDVGVDKVTIAADGSATVAVIGLIARIVVPGEGLVGAETGRLVLFFEGPGDEEPDVLFKAGHDDDVDAAICAALAP
jgi:hypothetical protein